jgi:lipoyl(octanoyl) transferase
VRQLAVQRLGRVPYQAALELQRTLVEDRRAGRIPDTLLLLEHPHVLTIGVRRGGGAANILASPSRLQALGVEIVETGRGGDVTYHGPGQVVAYPIFDLRPDRQDVHRYVRDLEDVMIRVANDFGVSAEREKGLTGAWVPTPNGAARKIGAIGVRISRWITSHGLAFNVNTDLTYFDLIVPCGIADRGVTSLKQLSSVERPLVEVEDKFVSRIAEVFGCEVESAHIVRSADSPAATPDGGA